MTTGNVYPLPSPAPSGLGLRYRPPTEARRCPRPLGLGRVPAGFPSPAEDYVDRSLDLNDYLLTHPAATFFYRVEGDSMIQAGILEGDIVVVDRSLEAQHGDIVIATVNNENTLKRLYCQGGRTALQPENPAYRPLVLQDGQELTVWGVVVGVVRKLKP